MSGVSGSSPSSSASGSLPATPPTQSPRPRTSMPRLSVSQMANVFASSTSTTTTTTSSSTPKMSKLLERRVSRMATTFDSMSLTPPAGSSGTSTTTSSSSSAGSSASRSTGVAFSALPKQKITLPPSFSSSSSVSSAPRASENQTLFSVLRTDNYDKVKAFLGKEGVDPNQADSSGFTPLMITADKGYLNSMRALVEAGLVNVNTEGPDQLTPMHLASRANFVACISYLQKQGADLEPLDKDGMSPLHHAAINGALGAIRELSDLGAIRLRTDGFGCTPLYLFKAFLQEQGALAHNKDRYDKATREEIIGLLTPSPEDEKESRYAEKTVKLKEPVKEKPASSRVVTAEKPKPVQTTKGPEFADIFYQQMLEGIKRRDTTTIEVYLFLNGDPNYEYSNGYTLLMCLAERGLTKTMSALIDAGADVNKGGNVGLWPIHCAAASGFAPAISLLHKKGADIEQPAKDGSRPLHNAIWAKQLPSIVILLDLKANYNKAGCQGCNTIPRLEFVKMLKLFHEKHGGLPEHFTNVSGAAMLRRIQNHMHLTK
jgi:ankyrin repeat protein